MNIIEVDPWHALRGTVESHIATVYRRAFGASVPSFASRLYAMVGAHDEIRCAAGVRRADEEFHSECYLDGLAEQAVSQALSRSVCRTEILEFTTLACARPGDALVFVSDIVGRGRLEGCNMALFTGTASLRKLLSRAGLTVVPVAAARRERIADPHAWGRYYEADPHVCIAPDSPALPRRLRAPCFPSVRGFEAGTSVAPHEVAVHA